MIKLNNINKTYKIRANNQIQTKQASNDISFEITDGEIAGVLGLNGAGKSTLIKMMCGILTPDSGEILVNGFVPYKRDEKFLKSIGLMMGNRSSLFYDLPIKDSFDYLKIIYDVKNDENFDNEFNKLLEALNISGLLDKPVRKLSLGERKKAELAASMIYNPSILFLDEPTIGMDVKSKKETIEFIKRLNSLYGTTIILTSHDLNDIERICDRLIYLDNGHISYDGEMKDFYNIKNSRKVTIIFNKNININPELGANKIDDFTYSFIIEKDKLNELLSKFDSKDIEEFEATNATLEDMVLKYD